MSKLRRAALLTGIAFAIPTAINYAISLQRRDLSKALPGESGEYAWPLGNIFYQARGEGRPLVLIHGIGAGGSSYEWRHNFDALSERYRVYALDLPGFGKSERRDMTYTADLYITAIQDFLRDVVQEPACVIASSLSAAYAVKIAHARPELIERLVLLCPTGLERLRAPIPVLSSTAYGVFSLPAVGQSLFNGIASYKYIESYAREHLYVDPLRVTPALVEQYYNSAHQPNARFALRSFLSGLLTCDIRREYPELQQPVLIAWGRQALETPVENARRFLADQPNALLRVFENSRLLPHDEEAEDFNAAAHDFLSARLVPSLLAEANSISASLAAENGDTLPQRIGA